MLRLYSGCTSLPRRIIYDVPHFKQTTNLCWAYVQVMAENFHKNLEMTPVEAEERAMKLALTLLGEKEFLQGASVSALDARLINNENNVNPYWLADMLDLHGPLFVDYFNPLTDRPIHVVILSGIHIMSDNEILVYINHPSNNGMNICNFNMFLTGSGTGEMAIRGIYVPKVNLTL